MSKPNFVVPRYDLTALAIEYNNAIGNKVADVLSPRADSTTTQTFKYLQHFKGDNFRVPDTSVTRLGATNQVSNSNAEVSAICDGYGLEGFIPRLDRSVGSTYNQETKTTRQVAELMALDREIKVVNNFVAPGTYLSAQRPALTGTAQWSDYTNSDPVDVILQAADVFEVRRPNVFWMTRPVWTKVRQHTKVVNAVKGVVANSGKASIEQFAELIEIPRIVIIDTWKDANKFGNSTVALSRIGGKAAGMCYLSPSAGAQGDATFALTVDWVVDGQRGIRALQSYDPDMGVLGTDKYRMADFYKDLFPSNELGYLWQTAVA